MSKLSQELQVLYFLNERRKNNRYTKLSEILDYLDLDYNSSRHVRRYLYDLDLSGFYIETKRGSNGGYMLQDPLSEGLLLMSNISLAILLSMKHNQKIEESLKELPNYISSKYIEGDNDLSTKTLDNLCDIVNAIKHRFTIAFNYKDIVSKIIVEPYRIIYTNHSYYLYGINNKKMKVYDVSSMNNIEHQKKYKKDETMDEYLKNFLNDYGVKLTNNKATLKVRCKDKNALNKFIKYFENKGKVNGLEYEVSAHSENELFYPLFRISADDYVILNDEFKANYVAYLEKYLTVLKG